MKRSLLLCAVLLSASAPAAAQTPARVHISFGYRYIRARSLSTNPNPSPGIGGLPLGGELGITVRVLPIVSLVGAAGRSWSTAVTVPDGFSQIVPAPTGKASFSVMDFMGGAKFSRAGRGLFVELLAGVSMPSTHFEGTSKAGKVLNTLDQGGERSFAARPLVGVDFAGSSRRVGGRVEAGFDIIPRIETIHGPDSVFHFRVAASAAVGLGAPMPPPTPRSAPAHSFYMNASVGLERKDPGTRVTKTMPVGGVGIGGRLSTHLGVEAVVEMEPATSIDWKWRYLFGQPYTNNRATHRDTLLLGQARWLGVCAKRACFEPFGGAGFVAHHAVDRVVADCGTDLHPKNPCEAVSPTVKTDEWQWGFAWAAGAAVKVVISPKVSVGPSAQVSYLGHTRDLFRTNFRGPDSGSRFVPSFGMIFTIKP